MAEPRKTPNWLRPLWVRILICVVPVLWSGVEFHNENTYWGLAFLAVAIYGVWEIILRFQPGE